MFRPLSEVSSKYGAPMGRRDTQGDPDVAHRLYVHHMPFVDDCYDAGGAYWGMGEPLWRAVEDDGDVELFMRAKDRSAAVQSILEDYPLAVILDLPREGWFEDFVAGYEYAALWSSTDTIIDADGGEHDVDLNEYELAEETKAKFRADCEAFCDANEPHIVAAMAVDGYTAERAGHDFWMNRSGHGCGYWDRSELPKPVRDALSEASKEAGERDLYIGDDGLIYQQ